MTNWIRFRVVLTVCATIVALAWVSAGAATAAQPSDIRTTVSTDDPVNALAITPDDRYMLTGGWDNEARIWDLRSNRLLQTLRGHTLPINQVSISDDARLVLTSSSDNTVRIWNTASGEMLQSYPGIGAGEFTAAALSPDGKTFVIAGADNVLHAQDAVSGQTVFDAKLPIDIVRLAYSHDGSSVVVAGKAVAILDARSGRILSKFQIPQGYAAVSLSISADDSTLAVTTEDSNVALYDLRSGHMTVIPAAGVLRKDKRMGVVSAASVALSADGSRLAYVGQAFGMPEMLRLVDVRAKRQIEELGGDGFMFALQFDVGGSLFVGAQSGIVKHDAANLRSQVGVPVDYSARINWRADGTFRTINSRGDSQNWNFVSGATSGSSGPSLFADNTSYSFSADGSEVAILNEDDKAIRVYSTTTWVLLAELPAPSPLGHAIGLSPDGSQIAVSSYRGWPNSDTFEIINVGSGRVVAKGTTPIMVAVKAAFSADGQFVVFGGLVQGAQGCAAAVHQVTGKLLHVFKPGTTDSSDCTVEALTFSPAGTLLAMGDSNGIVRIWDAVHGSKLSSAPIHVGTVNSVDFAGQNVLSTGQDGDVVLSNPASGARMWTAPGGAANTASLSPDNALVAVGRVDGSVEILGATDGRSRARLIAPQNEGWIELLSDGFFSGTGAGAISVVRGLSPYSIDQAYQALYRPDLVAEALKGDPDGKVAAAAAKLDLTTVVESGPAPEVAITSPAEGNSVDADSVAVTATVADQGGGIGKLEWRVNGITLGVDTRGFDRLQGGAGSGGPPSGPTAASGGGAAASADASAAGAANAGSNGPNAAPAPSAPITVTRTLSLDPGDNDIELVAYNAKGLIASEPAKVTVKWDGASSTTPPKLYVLSVGVNDYYDGRLQLNYAVPDAEAIGTAFATAGKGLYSSVEVKTVLNGDVTAANLDKVFGELSAEIKPRDVFVFFMSGHGKTEDGRYYFIPADFKYVDDSSIASGGIDQDKFQSWLAEIPARKSVLLYDTCDSGSLTTSGLAARGLEEVAAVARMTRAMGRTMLTASTDDAPALEGYNGHGVFTYALLDALDTADTNNDGVIDVTELAAAIDRSVPDISYATFKLRQIPQMSIVGSDFPLADKADVLAVANTSSPAVEGASSAADASALPAIPTTPTHVVIAATDVHRTIDPQSEVVTILSPGDQVRVIASDGTFAEIARQGQNLGYVPDAALLALH